MQIHRRKSSRTIGAWLVGIAIAAGVVVCGASQASAEEETTRTGNRVFFRGGFAALNSSRGGELFTNVHGLAGGPSNDDSTGYYIGAGTDLMLTRDAWGLADKVGILGEIGMEYNRFSSQTVANSDTALTGAPFYKTQVTMLTIDVAPKIKFRQGTDFQPWLIPVGLDFHVISPPSNQTNYLDIGAQFGVGGEVRVWKELWLGVDGRYHLASGATNTVNNYGTVGAYVGIGF
ncbi:MAG: hypothetical protein P0111_00325 [Nitrospira sp.]|nr:hypothetical protein [Nitrospira sp.]